MTDRSFKAIAKQVWENMGCMMFLEELMSPKYEGSEAGSAKICQTGVHHDSDGELWRVENIDGIGAGDELQKRRLGLQKEDNLYKLQKFSQACKIIWCWTHQKFPQHFRLQNSFGDETTRRHQWMNFSSRKRRAHLSFLCFVALFMPIFLPPRRRSIFV